MTLCAQNIPLLSFKPFAFDLKNLALYAFLGAFLMDSNPLKPLKFCGLPCVRYRLPNQGHLIKISETHQEEV
jgi:hypothetical protein